MTYRCVPLALMRTSDAFAVRSARSALSMKSDVLYAAFGKDIFVYTT